MKNKNREKRKVDRFAGEVFENKKKQKRDWSQANWDDPSKKEMKKFEKATGYPQYLGGFRDEYRDDYMADGQIDYFSDHRAYDKAYKKIGKNTGLIFNRVKDPLDAEIYNSYSPRTSERFIVNRKDRKGGTGMTYNYPVESFETRLEDFKKANPQYADNPNVYIGGTSYEIDPSDPKTFGSEAAEYFKDVEDMHQLNVINALKGDKKSRNATVWHEIGHSLGLEGDLTLTDKDPSVMSYNQGIRGNKFGTREYESIKRLHQPYM